MTVTVPEAAPAVRPAVWPVTDRDVLLRAADLLEEFGWCRGEYGGKALGRMCATQAITEAAQDLAGLGDLYEVWDAAYSRFTQHFGVITPTGYNDAPGRTKADVVAALREAAVAMGRSSMRSAARPNCWRAGRLTTSARKSRTSAQ